MSLLSKLVQFLRLLRQYWRTRSLDLAHVADHVRLPSHSVVVRRGKTEIRRWNLQLSTETARHIIKSWPLLLDLEKKFPESFSLSLNNNSLILSAAGINLDVRTWSDVDVMHEVLVRELYHFKFGRPTVVWDVGMNIGMAALYFATLPNVQAVYGYELFKPTWQHACDNLRLNSGLTTPVTMNYFGVGDKSAILELPYSEELKNVVGLNGPMVAHKDIKLQLETVEVKPATEILNLILSKHPNLGIVLKMDCEGAEGDILESLANAGMIRNLDLIILEWHGEEMRQKVENLLSQQSFVLISQPFQTYSVGTLTAFRTEPTHPPQCRG